MHVLRKLVVCLSLTLPSSVAAERICDDQFNKVCIETVQTDDSITFYAENRHALLPVTLKITLSLINLRRDVGSVAPQVLAGNSRIQLFKLRPKSGARWSYRYEFSWSRGDVTARHNDQVVYRLPFARGKSFVVGQSCNGALTHFGETRYAVDFDMPVGTPVHAARSGRVVAIKQDSRSGGASARYQYDGNYVILQHEDRTLGQYVHLKQNGAAVRLGDLVPAGGLLGYSGNTGQSTGPHLHFDVIKGSPDVRSETLPVRFLTQQGTVQCPVKGSKLTAVN